MKRIISIAIILSLLVAFFSFPVFAEATITGTGTDNDPFIIDSLHDWELIGTDGYPMNATYHITNDIECYEDGTGAVSKTIGGIATHSTEPEGFSGKIIGKMEGRNPVIKVAISSGYNYQGLVAFLNGGTVENITIEGSISGRGYVGSVSGKIDGATIKNVVNKASITSSGLKNGAANQASCIGGIAGGDVYKNASNQLSVVPVAASLIENCINYGTVTATNESTFIGGIIGVAYSDNDLIKNCINNGAVIKTASAANTYIGGIVGELKKGDVMLCANTGNVSVTNAEGKTTIGAAGGIAGDIYGHSAVSNIEESYNTGNISGYNYAGGIIGNKIANTYGVVKNCYNTGDVSTVTGYAGGIVSDVATTSIRITNTYNTGAVIIGENAGYMLAGKTGTASTLPNSNFYLSDLNGITPVCGETAKTSDELKALADTLGNTIWMNGSPTGNPYPQLIENLQDEDAGEVLPDGSIDNPYQIKTLADLEKIDDSDANLSAHYVLINSIEEELKTPLASAEKPFSGVFNGDGNSIKLGIVSENNYVGLFAKTSLATIENLELTGSVKGASYVGALTGDANRTTIKNVTNRADVTSETTATSSYAGGITGYVSYTNGDTTKYPIYNCYNYGAVSGNKSSVGGIVGYFNSYKSGAINNAYNYGNISAERYAGGIIGAARYLGYAMSVFANHGNVSATINTAGGIIGYVDPNLGVGITSVYNNGTISATGGVAGGIIGETRSTKGSKLTNAYNTGAITGASGSGIISYVYNGVTPVFAGVYNIGKANNPIVAYNQLDPTSSDVYYLDGNNTDDGIDYTTPLNIAAMKAQTIKGFTNNATGYSFPDITANLQTDATIDFWTITVNQPENGTVSPAGTIYVRKGEKAAFNVKADEEYALESVLFDGNVVGTSENVEFDVTGDGELSATFVSTKPEPNGTEEAPYEIYTLADLLKVNDNLSAYYKLMNNIDEEVTTPIGSTEAPFSGNFNGQNFTINLNIESQDDYTGLFVKTLKANIYDLKLKGSIKAGSYTGALIGQAVDTNVSDIESSVNVVVPDEETEYIGGIIGLVSTANTSATNPKINSAVSGLINNGSVTAAGDYVGGVIGYYNNYYGKISNLVNNGDVSGHNSVGGVIGQIKQNNGIITLLSNNGNVTSTYVSGGVIGYTQTMRSFESMYNNGNVTSNDNSIAGGIIGMFDNSGSTVCGIKNSYNTGKITAKDSAGIVGGFKAESQVIRLTGVYNIGDAKYPITSANQLKDDSSNIYYLDGNGKDDGIDYTTPLNLTAMKAQKIDGFTNNTGGYAFPDITANPQVDTTIDFWTVTVETPENGTVTPSGTVYVKKGNSKTFTFAANDGYTVDTVTFNGEAIVATESVTLNITSDSTLSVTFKAIPLSIVSTVCYNSLIDRAGAEELGWIDNSYAQTKGGLVFVKLSKAPSAGTECGIVISETIDAPEKDAANCTVIPSEKNSKNYGVLLLGNKTAKYYVRAYITENGKTVYGETTVTDVIMFK